MANTRKDLLECLIEFELAAGASIAKTQVETLPPFFHLK